MQAYAASQVNNLSLRLRCVCGSLKTNNNRDSPYNILCQPFYQPTEQGSRWKLRGSTMIFLVVDIRLVLQQDLDWLYYFDSINYRTETIYETTI